MKSPLNSSAIVKYTPLSDPQFKKTEEKKSKNLEAVSKFGKSLLKLFQKREKDNIKNDLDNKKELERQRALAEERKSEQKKAGGNILRSTLAKAKDIIGGLQHLIMGLVAYKILDWISNPKNFEQVKGLIIAVKGIFDFIGATINFGVTNLMEGISQLTTGSILERFFGLVKVLAGFFVLRWLLNPFKLIKDLGRLVRFIPKIKRLFSFLSNVGKKGILPALKDALKAAGAAKGLTAKSISKVVRRSLLRILGKGGFKALTAGLSKGGGAVAKALYKASGGVIKGGVKKSATRLGLKLLGKGGLKTAGKIFSKIPIIGGLLDFGINVALGDPVDKAAVKAVGATLGGALGGLIGSVIPGPGTIVGSILGGLLGDFLADKAYGFFKGISNSAGKKQAEGKDKIPGLATGGIVTKPTLAHLAEDEPEVVIPLSKVGPGSVVDSIIGRPFKIIGRAFLGGLMGMVGALGPLGFALQPLIKSLLGPFIKDYGVSKVPAKKLAQGPTSSNLKFNKIKGEDDGGGQLSKLIGTQPRENGTDVLSLLSRIKNNIGNMIGGKSGGSGTSGPTGTKSSGDNAGNIDTSGVEAASGSVVDKGVAIAKKFMSNLSMTKEAAAAIAGNFAHESGGFIPGIREGGPFGKSSKPWAQGTVGKGYGWAQWTNSAPGDRYDKFIQSYGGDYNKIPTNEDNLKFAIQEMRTTNKLSDKFKKMTDTAAAAVWFRKNWERAGVHHDGPRISYAKGILAKLAAGGKTQLKGNDAKWAEFYNYGRSAGAKYPELVSAQFALESGWGTKLSAKNNFFGIKATSSESGQSHNTREVYGGKSVYINAKFKNFNSPSDAVNHLVTQWYKDYKSYKGVNNASNAIEAASKLKQYGYATDPNYPQALSRLIRQNKAVTEKIKGGSVDYPAGSYGGPSGDSSSPSTGGQTTTPAESEKTGLEALAANPEEFTKNLASLFSLMTGAPDLSKGAPTTPTTTTLSDAKLKGITNTAFGKGTEIEKLSSDFSKYYETSGVGTVVYNQPPVIINNAMMHTHVAFSPDTSLSEKSLNLSKRL